MKNRTVLLLTSFTLLILILGACVAPASPAMDSGAD